ncbi:MAG: FKBP-type peptidyl-prolyl cis-trans isomerase [Theionarchaea archaeon]|nr:MAG: hypothetical protein AYK19_16945 [Theionarchaea archaeon DG-70-1]MBU7027587.1 FKBP-type peptidyl-prolyl cis-trans isomerase [Theionarchaea archaeon]
MNIKKTFVLLAVVIVIAAGAGIYFLMFYKTVEVGDTVFIDFTAYLDTGEIIDTTFEEVALDDTQPKVWWFRLRATYEPLKIVAGEGTLPLDLEMALIGMHEGEKKEVAIPPERAWGLRDPEKVIEISLVQSLEKEEEVPLEEFTERLRQDPVPDERYQLQDLTIVVLEVTEGKVKFRYELEEEQEIYIPLGNATVTGETDTEYELTLSPALGDTVYSAYLGQGIVIEIREDAMLVDFNPLLAGETINYTFWVVEIEKA